jgi:hypothetical protein
VIKVLEEKLTLKYTEKYLEIYEEVRRTEYPVEYSFLVTKVKFQDYIIKEIEHRVSMQKEIVSAYRNVSANKNLQDRAIRKFQHRKRVPNVNMQ